jgi:2-dehydropantoate 2-reductase
VSSTTRTPNASADSLTSFAARGSRPTCRPTFIAPYSAIGATSRVPIGVWRSTAETRELAVKLLREVLAVASARGATLADDAIERTMDRYDGLAPDATPSLQRDVVEGKPSELDAQLGAVVKMGRELHVPVPHFEALYAALLPLERKARGEVK